MQTGYNTSFLSVVHSRRKA